METTPNLAIRLVEQSQAQKEVTVNEALIRLDALQAGLLSRSLATPPGSPADGEAYLVGAGATGAWAGSDGKIAYYVSGWRYISPKAGMLVWINDELRALRYDGSAWQDAGLLARGPSAVLNGGFDVWQRGASIALSSSGYGADQWLVALNGSSAAVSRQAFTLGQTTVTGEPTYFGRHTITSVAGAGNYACLQQRIESVRRYAGQKVCVSFYAKAEANKSVAVSLRQNFGTGGSPSADVELTAQVIALTTSWQLFTLKFTLGSLSGKTIGTNEDDWLGLLFWLDAGSSYATPSGSIGQQSIIFDLAQVQLVPGDIAPLFNRRPFAEELQSCQRYYTKTHPYGTAPANNTGQTGALVATANGTGTGVALLMRWQYPVRMRATPSITTYNPSNTNGSWRNVTASTDLAVSNAQNCAHSVWLTNNAAATDQALYALHASASAEL